MKTTYSKLSSVQRYEIKSIMNGNGLKVSDAEIYIDGDKVVLYINKLNKFIKVN